jgi:hypothetical protein
MAKDDKRCAKGRRWFEYHCYEGEDSCDAKLWHHQHQEIIVTRKLNIPKEVDYGIGNMYHVQFNDGFECDVFEDELILSPNKFTRPDYIQSEEK